MCVIPVGAFAVSSSLITYPRKHTGKNVTQGLPKIRTVVNERKGKLSLIKSRLAFVFVLLKAFYVSDFQYKY